LEKHSAKESIHGEDTLDSTIGSFKPVLAPHEATLSIATKATFLTV
jgi:hypothetical protein